MDQINQYNITLKQCVLKMLNKKKVFCESNYNNFNFSIAIIVYMLLTFMFINIYKNLFM